jgi:hypothetical protein
MGWRAQRTAPLLPVARDVFSLDPPLYRTRLCLRISRQLTSGRLTGVIVGLVLLRGFVRGV